MLMYSMTGRWLAGAAAAETLGPVRGATAPVVGAAQCDALVEAVLALERVRDVRDLRPLLQKSR